MEGSIEGLEVVFVILRIVLVLLIVAAVVLLVDLLFALITLFIFVHIFLVGVSAVGVLAALHVLAHDESVIQIARSL